MIRLGVGLVLVIGLYTAGWFYFASQAKSWLQGAMQAQGDRPFAVDCQDLEIRGYPFRIGAFCSAVKIDAVKAGLSASIGQVRSAAQIYNPGHAVFEIDGPADIRSSFGFMANATWTNLRSSIVGGFSGLERSSVEGDNIHADLGDPLLPNAISADFQHGEWHVRQNGDNIDLATESVGLVVQTTILPVSLPAADVDTDVTLIGQGDVLKGKKSLSLRSSSGKLNQARIDFKEKGAIVLSGPFQFDEAGLLSGTFELKLSKIDELQKVLSASFPATAETINQVAGVLTGLSAGTGTATIKVSVRKGVVSVAFFELGRIPAI